MSAVQSVTHRPTLQIIAVCVGLLWSTGSNSLCAQQAISFNRDIRPILSNHCFSCHGPDSAARKGGFRLDQRDSATRAAESGLLAIDPGQIGSSQLITRIHSADPDLVMPPPETSRVLTDAQKNLLQRWIAEGAQYQPHWSLVPPQAATVPTVADDQWSRTEIDRFVLAGLRSHQLSPAAPAAPSILLRRLSLDLIGLPPTPAEADAFSRELQDAAMQGAAAEDAVVKRWIDHLFKSPHYGERMAVDWLDAARYADTNGYQVDRPGTVGMA